jgi:hypothetical protein
MYGHGLCWVSWTSGVEREGLALQGRETSSSPASACLGEEEDLRCHSKQHRFDLFLTIHETISF